MSPRGNSRPALRPESRRVLRFVPALAINATTPHLVAQLAGMTLRTAARELERLERQGLVRQVGRPTRRWTRWVRNYDRGAA